jgi:hypothetical protein
VLLGVIAVVLLTIGAPEPMLFLGTTGFALSGPVGAAWRVATIRRRRRAGPPASATASDVSA